MLLNKYKTNNNYHLNYKKMTNHTTTTKTLSMYLAILILFSSCSSTTMIQSSPSGAKIYIDGQPAGTTPYKYSDTKVVGSSTSVKLVKEGYEPMNAVFIRNEKADVGAIVGGVLFLVPFLWTMEYNPTHIYELSPVLKEQAQLISTSKSERIRELKFMLDEKLITQEEFTKEKKKILEEK